MKSSNTESSSKERWYPQLVDTYKNSIKVPYTTPENKRLLSNFAYSMQYIEYIEYQLSSSILSSVIVTMLYKSYIITGMSIIELLFSFLLKSSNNWKTTEWDKIETFISNPQKFDGSIVRTETALYKKISPSNVPSMSLDAMIKSVESKNLLSITHDSFPVLKKLRELRNRVHLQEGDGAYDHDYNAFNLAEIQMMRQILYTILTAPEICKQASTFAFINHSSST